MAGQGALYSAVVRPRGCDLLKGYRKEDGSEGVQFQKKTSTSEVVIFFGHSIDVGLSIAGKIFTSKMYEYEARVYAELVPKMAQKSRFFLPWVFTMDCNPRRTMQLIPRPLQTQFGGDTDVMKIIGTIKYPQTKTLAAFIRENNPAVFELLEIYVQVCAGIYVLEAFRGVHNDLFTRNVLVQDMGGAPEPYFFDIGGRRRKLLTRYHAMLFDWDRAYFEVLGPNPQLSFFCRDYAMCNHFEKGHDLLNFSCDMYDFLGADVFQRVFASLPLFVEQVLRVKTRRDCFYAEDADVELANANTFDVLSALDRAGFGSMTDITTEPVDILMNFTPTGPQGTQGQSPPLARPPLVVAARPPPPPVAAPPVAAPLPQGTQGQRPPLARPPPPPSFGSTPPAVRAMLTKAAPAPFLPFPPAVRARLRHISSPISPARGPLPPLPPLSAVAPAPVMTSRLRTILDTLGM